MKDKADYLEMATISNEISRFIVNKFDTKKINDPETADMILTTSYISIFGMILSVMDDEEDVKKFLTSRGQSLQSMIFSAWKQCKDGKENE